MTAVPALAVDSSLRSDEERAHDATWTSWKAHNARIDARSQRQAKIVAVVLFLGVGLYFLFQ